MSFSKKVFIAIFGSTLLVCSAFIWLAHHFIGERNRDTYLERYTSMSRILGNSITQLERNTESLMYDAAEVIADEDQKNGLLSTEQLKVLRTKLNLTHIFTVNKKGVFIRSTNEHPNLIPNLYSFCEGYKKLFTGNDDKLVTPIIPPKPEPASFKFLTISNFDKTRLIHVGVRVDFLQKALSSALADDPNILELNIYAPDGSSLGRFNKDGVNLERSQISVPQAIDSISPSKKGFSILTKVESPQTQCCQCDVSGISKGGAYYYVIESVVSDKELVAAQASMKNLFLVLQLLALFFAFFAGKFLSGKLVNRIELVTKSVRVMGKSGDNSSRIEITGNDEIRFLANEFNDLLDRLEKSRKTIIDSESKAKIGELARDIAHNINSPLLSMQNAMLSVNGPPEKMRMLRNAVGEIKDHLSALKLKSSFEEKNTTDDLFILTRPNKLKPAVYLVTSVLSDLVSEKVVQNKLIFGLEINFAVNQNAKSKFSRFDLTEFRSVISNLINNAVEATGETGRVKITLSSLDDLLSISIKDNGVGIAPGILPKIFLRDFTHGKENGSGLGLHHAKTQIERLGGAINIESRSGEGTEVIVSIPTVAAPEWFISEIDFSNFKSIVVIDDSPSIHDLWKSKITDQNFYSFSGAGAFEEWFSSNGSPASNETLYLVDYDLNDSMSGIDLIEKCSIARHSVLVTSGFDDQPLLARANWVGIKVMPKAML